MCAVLCFLRKKIGQGSREAVKVQDSQLTNVLRTFCIRNQKEILLAFANASKWKFKSLEWGVTLSKVASKAALRMLKEEKDAALCEMCNNNSGWRVRIFGGSVTPVN